MRRYVATTALASIWLLTASPILASEICTSTAGPDSIAEHLASVDTLRVRVLFITFPDAIHSNLPDWANDLASGFVDYIETMSRGARQVTASVVTRADSSTKAWRADSSAAYYLSQAEGYGLANAAVMKKVATALGLDYWRKVDHVIAIHYEQTLQGDVAGRAYLGCSGSGCQDSFPSLSAGTTQRIANHHLNETDDANQQRWVSAHEYGHLLRLNHTPGSENGNNPGRYDVMRNIASWSQDGFVPYHAAQLSSDNSLGPGWLPGKFQITANMEDLHIPSIRGGDPKVYEVRVPGSGSRPAQSFMLINHQTGSSSYDAKYLTSGLYLWHSLYRTTSFGITLPESLIDLESAAGKFNCTGNLCASPTCATPNPVSGKDPLERCASVRGTYDDAFDGTDYTVFACGTNPNTNLYVTSDPDTVQSIKTSIAFENIHTTGSDMVLDVYVTPRQKLTAPNIGGTFSDGTVEVEWTPRPYACITHVDIEVSRNGSAFEAIAEDEDNDGSYTWYPTEFGENYHIRVVSHDEAEGVGADTTDYGFAIAEPCYTPPCDEDPGRPDPAIMRIAGPIRMEGEDVIVTLDLPRSGLVRVDLYDVMGRHVGGRPPTWMRSGRSETLRWKEGRLKSGVYHARVRALGGEQAQGRLAIVR